MAIFALLLLSSCSRLRQSAKGWVVVAGQVAMDILENIPSLQDSKIIC
jgi:hypothetical protein